MQRLKTYIIVKTQFEGKHKYVNAPKEVEYLKNLHRHIFNVIVKIEVFNDDRELEFIMVKNKINKFLINKKWVETVSCEMIAKEILNFLQKNYKKRIYCVSVYEDNENGAIIECGMD